MTTFKINPLVLAMAIALPATLQAQGAFAQEDDTIEEIQVTGFRESLASSMNIKKEQNGFVDAIVASDIAEFPDNNLAESLQRVPGVSIQRSGGEGRGITVRGLGPSFTTVRLNGMETMSTTGGTDAGTANNRGRGFDFNTFSSDLFSSLIVHKTNSAEIQEGSLGATVDLKAAQPFDYDGFVLTASGQLGYNDLSEKTDPGASFLVSNTFFDGKFGALFSAAVSKRSVQDEGFSTVRWSNQATNYFKTVKGQTVGSGGTAGYTSAPTNPNDYDLVNGWCKDTDNNATTACALQDANRPFAPRIPRYDSYHHEMERTGASLSLQFRPTDTTEISVDGLFAQFDATRQEVFLEGSLNPGSNSASTPAGGATGNVLNYTIANNTLIAADLSGIRLLSENRYDEMTTKFSQLTVNLKQDFTDTFRMHALIGSTKSDFDNPIQNTLMMQADDQTLSYDYSNYSNPVLKFGNAAYTAASWKIGAVRQRPQGTINESQLGSVSFDYDFAEGFTLKVGADIRNFDFDTTQFALVSEGANGVVLSSNPAYIQEYDSGLGENRPWLIPNRGLIMSDYNLFAATMNPNYGNTYTVGEDTTGLYAQVDFKLDIGSIPVRGNIGVRKFETDQTSSGWLNGNLATRQFLTYEHSYSDLLPSFNLTVEPIEDLLIKASYSEGISRASPSQIVPVTTVAVAGASRTISTGTPNLEPTAAKSYDIGAEWYFDNEALVGVTLFKKEIESFITTARSTISYSASGFAPEAGINACAAAGRLVTECNTTTADWTLTVPSNTPGGDLTGYEISYQQPFTFLPGALSNFGTIVSYTGISSDIDYLDVNGKYVKTRPFTGLSDETAAVTVYYENETFSGRVAVTKRSGYITSAIGTEGSPENGTNGTVNVDASFGYTLDEHFKFTFEALNLTDEVDDQWVGEESNQRLSYYHSTGRQYNLGVQYKY